jgi:hypothetical protein
MIVVVEDILTELFALLPLATFANAKTAPITFSWGNDKDLAKYLKLRLSKVNYPLIWLVTGDEIENRMANVILRKCRLIIAINSIRETEINPSIWETDFRLTLNPLKENVLIALQNSGKTRIVNPDKVTVRREPNYCDEGTNKAKTIDIWNAIVLDLEVEFNSRTNCFQEIQFIN